MGFQLSLPSTPSRKKIFFCLLLSLIILVFRTDSYSEIELIRHASLTAGADGAVACCHWSDGGKGAIPLAEKLIEACNKPSSFKLLYDLDDTIEHKIEKIAKEMYGAGVIEFTPKVKETIERYKSQGFEKLPICMAKTSNSLTGDPNIKGAPFGFTLKISDIFLSAGAGFIVTMVGEVSLRSLIFLFNAISFQLVCSYTRNYRQILGSYCK